MFALIIVNPTIIRSRPRLITITKVQLILMKYSKPPHIKQQLILHRESGLEEQSSISVHLKSGLIRRVA